MKYTASVKVRICYCCILTLVVPVFAQEIEFSAARPKITVVSDVRLRTAPSVAAPEVTRLKFGQVVSARGRSAGRSQVGGKGDYWYRVQLATHETGWVFGGLLADYDPAHREELLLRVIRERLKTEEMSFTDATDLYDFASTSRAVSFDSLVALAGSLLAAHLCQNDLHKAFYFSSPGRMRRKPMVG